MKYPPPSGALLRRVGNGGLEEQPGTFPWPGFDERTAAGICYTSGTTGHPKGVLYSHHSTVLHAMALVSPSVLPLYGGGATLPVVSMFHVMAWGVPYGAAIGGCKLVLPGPRLDGPGLTELMNADEVEFYCAFGELQIRGPWVASAYLGDEPGSALDDGWFSTGDVATLAAGGSVRITDRRKDLIKSGGEWINSIDLEDLASRHPEIAQAAVIGVPHEKWGERPLLIAVVAKGGSPTREGVLEFLEGQVPSWWLPDDVRFVETLPVGGTGKVQKNKLGQEYGGTFA